MGTEPDLFAQFRTIVKQEFGFLVDEFGFKKYSSGVRTPECWVAFRTATTGVTVMFELGAGPWVEVARLGLHEGRTVELERYSLDFLLMERAPLEERTSRCDGLDDPQLAAILARQAHQLRAHAEDILNGDFHIFPRLKGLAESAKRKWEQEVFGSSEGE